MNLHLSVSHLKYYTLKHTHGATTTFQQHHCLINGYSRLWLAFGVIYFADHQHRMGLFTIDNNKGNSRRTNLPVQASHTESHPVFISETLFGERGRKYAESAFLATSTTVDSGIGYTSNEFAAVPALCAVRSIYGVFSLRIYGFGGPSYLMTNALLTTREFLSCCCCFEVQKQRQRSSV